MLENNEIKLFGIILLTNTSDIVKQLNICDKEMLLTSLEAIKMIVYDRR